jgi:hypothetical protein
MLLYHSLISDSVVVSHLLILIHYVLEVVPSLITLYHHIRERGGVSARGSEGLDAAWIEPHTMSAAGTSWKNIPFQLFCQRRYENFESIQRLLSSKLRRRYV